MCVRQRGEVSKATEALQRTHLQNLTDLNSIVSGFFLCFLMDILLLSDDAIYCVIWLKMGILGSSN